MTTTQTAIHAGHRIPLAKAIRMRGFAVDRGMTKTFRRI